MGKRLFIINPGASGGKGKHTWDRFRSVWPHEIDPADITITEGPGHATDIANSIKGYDTIVAVGGDGTVNEIINGIAEQEALKPRLAIIPAGTGNDVARTVGLYPFDRAVGALEGGHDKAFDLIRVLVRDNGREIKRYSLLTCSFGFSVSAQARPWVKRVFGATVAYYLTAIEAILAHRSPFMRVSWEEGDYEGRTWMIIASNVESVSGGSMRVAPGACPDDGCLWVTIIEPKPKLTMMLKVLPKVAAGNHLNETGMHFFHTSGIEMGSDVRTVVDIDGEEEHATWVNLNILPSAIRILLPESE